LALTVLTSLDDGALLHILFERTAAEQVVGGCHGCGAGGKAGLVCSPLVNRLIAGVRAGAESLVTPGVPRAGWPAGLTRTLSAAER